MFGRISTSAGALALVVGLFGLNNIPSQAGGEPTAPSAVRIGLVGSLFKDVPAPAVAAIMQPFAALMKVQTGVRGELVPIPDADTLGQQLATDKVQLGVFHGIELAWARQKHPELRALMIAVNQARHLRALVVVRSDSPLASFADLDAKILAMPQQSKLHCRVYLDRKCADSKINPQKFFGKVSEPVTVEEALDDVVDGLTQAAIVDGVSLDCFKRRKPGRFARLKVIQTSEIFPAAAIAYRPGTLGEATIKRFHEGMMSANQTIFGRQLLTLWKLSGFEPVPADYDETLANIVKFYPAPAGTTPVR